MLVLVTLFGALPMYRRVAKESPHGDGSLSMLERLLSYWPSKVLVLSLIGFVATGFIITITLSAADASAHLVENPFLTDALHGQEVWLTLVLLALLGAVFLKGFGEAIGIAVVLVVGYIGLSAVVVVERVLAHRPAPRHLHRLDQRRHPTPTPPRWRSSARLCWCSPHSRSVCRVSRPVSWSCPWSRATRATRPRNRRAASATPRSC